MIKPQLKHCHIVKLGRFLNMMYKPGEVAEEIGVSQDTIYRSYLPAGLPHERDAQGNIWIHGPAFVDWAKQTVAHKRESRTGLPDGHAWCLKCRKSVPIQDPHIRTVNRYLELIQGRCPTCGKKINRAQACQSGGEA
jgi:hypothetical protein